MQGLCSFFRKGQWTDRYLVPDGRPRHLGNPLPLVRDLGVFKESQIVEGVGRAFILPQRVTSEKEPKAVPWPSTDPGSGAAPRTTSSSRSSSPSKVMDEGKVSISGNL